MSHYEASSSRQSSQGHRAVFAGGRRGRARVLFGPDRARPQYRGIRTGRGEGANGTSFPESESGARGGGCGAHGCRDGQRLPEEHERLQRYERCVRHCVRGTQTRARHGRRIRTPKECISRDLLRRISFKFKLTMTKTFSVALVDEARAALRGIVKETPLIRNRGLSEKYGARVFLKREDLQVVRSYKLRGAYNRMRLLTPAEKKRGIVCASAGNHAQGVAFSCAALKVHGTVFMPQNTPRQKIDRVHALGGKYVEVELTGDAFDEAYEASRKMSEAKKMTFVHPFNDPLVIAGQGTVGAEILEELTEPIDYLVVPVGGGGLISGTGSYFKAK